MAEEMEEKGAWVPLTPANSLPALYCTIKALNHDVDALGSTQFSPILSEIGGHAENDSGDCGFGFGNFDRDCQGTAQVAENRGGLLLNNGASDCVKRVEDCSGAVAAKSGYAESGSESLGFAGTEDGRMGDNTDKGANPETIRHFPWNEGTQLHNNVLNGELRSDSKEPSSMPKNQTPKKRSNKGIDSDKQPRKRMRMKKHRPKVFDETKPVKTSTSKSRTRRSSATPRASRPSSPKAWTPRPSTPKPQTPRHTKYAKKDTVNIPVDFLKDVDKSSSRRKLDFSMESCTVDQISKASSVIENKTAVKLKKDDLNIPVDSLKDGSCCDRDESVSQQELDFGSENCIMDQDEKACDMIENETAVELKKDDLNIPVDSLKDGSCCDHDESFSQKELDFGWESCIMDQDSKACDRTENKPEGKLNENSLDIPVDSLKDGCCCDHDNNSIRQKLDFSLVNCMMDQNLNACNGVETKSEVEPKLRSDDKLKGLKVYQRKLRRRNCIMDQNSKACNAIENKSEVGPKSHAKNRLSCLKVYRRKFSRGNCIMDQKKVCDLIENKSEVEPKLHADNITSYLKVYQRKFNRRNRITDQSSKAFDAIENESEVQPKLHDDSGFGCLNAYQRILGTNECLVNSKKLGPSFPSAYKRKRMRRQKTTVLDKFVNHVAKILRPQRQRRMCKQMNSCSTEESSNNPQKLSWGNKSLTACVSTKRMRRKAVEHPTLDKCTLNLTWKVNLKRKRSRIPNRRRSFSCFFRGVSPPVNFRRKRSKTSSRRKDYSSFINVFPTLQVSEAFPRRGSILERKEHFSELDNARPHILSRKHGPNISSQSHDYVREALVDFAVMMIESLHIDDRCNQLVVQHQIAQGALVTSKGKFTPKKRKQMPKVDLDSETMRVWNLLMENEWSEETGQEEDDKTKYWREQREIFGGRVESFIARMHLVQGDRRFSPWKGSVVDSVVGVFLTQNVSDFLSSSAFMNLAAKYPPSAKLAEPSSTKCTGLVIMEKYLLATHCNEVSFELEDANEMSFQTEPTTETPKENLSEKQESKINWDELRTKSSHGRSRNRTNHALDSVNWEAVRQAPVEDVARVIMERGMNNMLAKRIKDFLDRLVRDHGSIDLEWLRDVQPDKAKEYLLSITGLGLKSVECVRLLTLRHHAFPVDTNVGRILVRLGWVPLQPLPGDIQIHLLNDYPPLDTIQKYVWPRLCHLTKLTLYELHYQLITFGKLFCTKQLPNCNACPLRGECRHFASAYASGKLRLEGPRDKNKATEPSVAPSQESMEHTNPQMISVFDGAIPEGVYQCHSINCEPIVELPASPEPVCREILERDIEDFGYVSSDEEIPTIILNSEEFKKNLLSFMGEEDVSKALTILSPETASIPMPKLKYVERLRTVHQVYELPDSHILLAEYEKREPDDPCPYLLVIWTPDELMNPFQDSMRKNQVSKCDMAACCSGDIVQYENGQFVRGTILIPCRTANRGSFPLNGTYFQVNEVFADYESSRQPIHISREWIWNLRRRALYCGTSATSISRGMSMEEIVYAFRKGFICVRGFDRLKRAPRPLSRRFHLCKTRKADDDA